MSGHKFITSISTIPNDSKHYSETTPVAKSFTNLKNPYKETQPMKFHKDKTFRKKTQATMLTQTIQNPQRSSIRNYKNANRSIVFDEPERQKRIAREGLFQSLSRESATYRPATRSIEDLGVDRNRKRVIPAVHAKPDPIIIGQKNIQHNSALQKVWSEPRRHRDNGKFCEESMVWNTRKPQSYLQLYKKKTETKNQKMIKFSV